MSARGHPWKYLRLPLKFQIGPSSFTYIRQYRGSFKLMSHKTMDSRQDKATMPLILSFFNPLTPKGSPFEEKNRLALDRVKSLSHLGCKGLRQRTMWQLTKQQQHQQQQSCLSLPSACFVTRLIRPDTRSLYWTMDHYRWVLKHTLFTLFCLMPFLDRMNHTVRNFWTNGKRKNVYCH